MVIKNGCGLFVPVTLKSAVCQEWTDEMRWFFACWYKFRIFTSYFDNYWVGIVKNGWDLIDHSPFKSGVSHKWFDGLSRLIEWFLHVDSDQIIFGLMTNLLCILTFKYWGPLQLYIAGVFRKNPLCAKVIPKTGSFLYFKKCCHCS